MIKLIQDFRSLSGEANVAWQTKTARGPCNSVNEVRKRPVKGMVPRRWGAGSMGGARPGSRPGRCQVVEGFQLPGSRSCSFAVVAFGPFRFTSYGHFAISTGTHNLTIRRQAATSFSYLALRINCAQNRWPSEQRWIQQAHDQQPQHHRHHADDKR